MILEGAGIVIRFFRWLKDLWQYLIVKQIQLIHREIEPAAIERPRGSVAFLMVWVAVILTVIEYYAHSGTAMYKWFIKTMPNDIPYKTVYRHAYWSLNCAAAYLFLPLLAILFTRGTRIRDYGLKLKGFSSHLWIYVMLFLIVMPAVVAVSYAPSFQRTYPFYRLAGRSWTDLGIWWAVYGIQFFCLEFFFRGYILHGLKKDVGAHAILFSAVPYCMIHFGKPVPETLGSIIAGVALGILSLRTLSVWSGFLIHISVAFCMDILSLWQKGKLSLFM